MLAAATLNWVVNAIGSGATSHAPVVALNALVIAPIVTVTVDVVPQTLDESTRKVSCCPELMVPADDVNAPLPI